MAKNIHNQKTMELTDCDDVNCFSILKMFEQCQEVFPVESDIKLYVCGNAGVGKSSLAAAVIMEQPMKPPNYKFDKSDPIPVELQTSGINSYNFSSHEIGYVVLHDFAGHEYYSSHAAILGNLMLSTLAVFAILSKMILFVAPCFIKLYLQLVLEWLDVTPTLGEYKNSFTKQFYIKTLYYIQLLSFFYDVNMIKVLTHMVYAITKLVDYFNLTINFSAICIMSKRDVES